MNESRGKNGADNAQHDLLQGRRTLRLVQGLMKCTCQESKVKYSPEQKPYTPCPHLVSPRDQL